MFYSSFYYAKDGFFIIQLICDFRFANGFDFNGERFVLIKVEEDVINAKSKAEGKQPLTIQKCNTCMVIMLGTAGSNGGSVSVAVNKMATYLKDNNY